MNKSNNKTCKICNQIKESDSFNSDENICLECHAIYNAEKKNQIRLKRNKNAEKDRLNNPSKMLFVVAKSRAKKMGLEFNIDISDIIIPSHCPVLGIEIRRAYGSSGPCDNSPTVDRINNKLGYIRGNVKVISWRANRIKNNGSKEELEKVISYIENNLPNGQINK